MLAEIAFNYELLGPKNNKDRDYVVELCSSNDKTIPMLVELVPASNPDSPRYLVRIPLILISTNLRHLFRCLSPCLPACLPVCPGALVLLQFDPHNTIRTTRNRSHDHISGLPSSSHYQSLSNMNQVPLQTLPLIYVRT